MEDQTVIGDPANVDFTEVGVLILPECKHTHQLVFL